MATPAQTQVTLDASQFIDAVDQIGQAITQMNTNIGNSKLAFNVFATTATQMEISLEKISGRMLTVASNTYATTQAIQQLTSVQNSMNNAMTQVAISTRAAAQSLDQMANASTRAGQSMVNAGRTATFAWDGILRLLTVTTIRRIFLDIAASMREAVSASAEFTEKVGLILAVNQNLGTSVQGLSTSFVNLSIAFNRPLAEVANAGLQAVQSGVAQTGQQVEQVTSAVGRLAQITGTTLPQSMTATTAVLRAFRLGASDTQTVTNQLNHIFQSGIGLNEIGSSIGRVSAQAQRLGINFSELGLLMEHIKATGVSDAEVITQVTALLGGIEQQTPALRNTLANAGIFNPQQLIQAERLAGAITRIRNDISDENLTNRQAVQSRRAGGGLSVAESFSQASTNNPLNNVAALQQNSEAALRIVTSTQQWNTELQKIKTIFESEIAPGLIKSIIDTFKPLGGFGQAAADAGRQIAVLLELGIRLVNGFSIWGDAAIRFAETIGFVSEASRLNREALQKFSEASREGGERLNTWVSQQRQAAQESLQAGTQSIANYFAPVNAALARQSELQRERVHELAEQIDASSKSVLAGFASQISSLESAARQAESRISESLKRVAEFGDKTGKDAFEHRLHTAGEVTQTSRFTSDIQSQNAYALLIAQGRAADNQINLIRTRRQRLNEEIEQLQAAGDANSIAMARRRFDQLRQLNDQENDIREAARKRVAEFDSRSSGQDQTYVSTNAARETGARALNDAERAFEQANRDRLARQQEQLERINNQLREQLRLVQDGQHDVGRLPQQLLGTNGLPRQNFQGQAGGQRAGTLIGRMIDDQIARVRALPETIERSIQTALRGGSITPEQADQARRRAPSETELAQLITQLEQQKIATQALFANAEARRVSEANQQSMINSLQAIANNTAQAIQRAAETREQQRNLLQSAQERINDIRGRADNPTRLRLAEGDAEGARIATALQTAIINADRSLRTAARTNDQTDIEAAQSAIRRVAELSRQLSSRPGSNLPTTDITRLENILTRLQTTIEQRPVQEAAVQGAQQTQQEVNAVIQNANIGNPVATIQGSITAFENLSTSLNPGGAFPSALISLSDTMVESARRIQEATANLQVAPAQGLASGGLIGNSFSSFGPDNTMIHARRGEFVVNPDSTRKFYATLVAINRGDNPRGGGYAHGGTVSNNIGTMNFHVSGADNPQQTAHAVMKIIRREQRRGNV